MSDVNEVPVERKIATGENPTTDTEDHTAQPAPTNGASHDTAHVDSETKHLNSNESSNETSRHSSNEVQRSDHPPKSPVNSVTAITASVSTPLLTENGTLSSEHHPNLPEASTNASISTPIPTENCEHPISPSSAAVVPSNASQPAMMAAKNETPYGPEHYQERTEPVNGHAASSISTPEQHRHHNPSSAAKTAADSIKLDKEIAHLKETISGASPKALQRVLRDNWRPFLFEGASSAHVAYMIRALMKNATDDAINRVGTELIFQGGILHAASESDKVVQQVFRKASVTKFLQHIPEEQMNSIMASQVKTVPAKTLIRWLAQGDRLGYQMDDILGDGEMVTPNVPNQPSADVDITNGGQGDEGGQGPRRPPSSNFQNRPRNDSSPNRFGNGTPPGNGPHSLSADPVVANKEREVHAEYLRMRSLEHNQWQQFGSHPGAQRLQCPSCHSSFYDPPGYNYHVTKKICHKEPNGYKFSCYRCYQGFSTKQGQEYHCKKEVCAGHDVPSYMETPAGQLLADPTAFSRPPMIPRTSSGPAVHHTHPTQPGAVAGQLLPTQEADHEPAVAIPRPPLHTPRGRRGPVADFRHSPSELSPEKLARLNQELADEDAKYARSTAAAQDLPEVERTARLISLKNGNASKKSQIRKKYGVSLRLREKDKAARKAAAAAETPPPNPRLSAYMAAPMPPRTSSAGSTVPTIGFSPINARQQNASSHTRRSPYGAPPASFPVPPQRPSVASSNAPLHHAHTDQHPGTFGMLLNGTPRYAPQNQMTSSTFAEQRRNAKRRRSEDDDGHQSIRSSYYSMNTAPASTAPAPRRPRMSMMEVSSQDAATKYPKKALIPGQTRDSPPLSSTSPVNTAFSSTAPPTARTSVTVASRDQDTPMTDAPAPRQAEPVYISISSEDESEAPEVHPRPASSHQVLQSIEGSNASRRASADNARVMTAGSNTFGRRDSSARPLGIVERGDTTEDEDSTRPGRLVGRGDTTEEEDSAPEPVDDSAQKVAKIAENARVAEEQTFKNPEA